MLQEQDMNVYYYTNFISHFHVTKELKSSGKLLSNGLKLVTNNTLSSVTNWIGFMISTKISHLSRGQLIVGCRDYRTVPEPFWSQGAWDQGVCLHPSETTAWSNSVYVQSCWARILKTGNIL